MRSGADLNSVEDDFEWVNAWAVASAREQEQVPSSSAPAETPTPAAAPADTAVAAPPLAQSSSVRAADETAAPRDEPRAARDPVGTAPPPAQPSNATPVPEPVAVMSAVVANDARTPSLAEIESLPLVDAGPPALGRRPWTSLFRLVAGGAGQPTERPSDLDIVTETVSAELPAQEAGEIAPLPQHDDEHIPLAPDQLARDIAEIEIVRDQLLAQPAPVALVPEVPSAPGRTSDLAPILVGTALGFILLVVFGAAASFVSLR